MTIVQPNSIPNTL
uniref:Uncharacterized protein n=1 Tax=Arundo donax TaxID=35708 RepID=A0A0A9BUM1_ARUDO